MIKSVKRLGAAVLSAVMMLTAVATPLGDNLPAVRESTSLTAGAAQSMSFGTTRITDKNDSRVTDALNQISIQANVNSCNQSGKSVRDMIYFLLLESPYRVFGGSNIPEKYANSASSSQTKFYEETKYGASAPNFFGGRGCIWFARYVATIIYGENGTQKSGYRHSLQMDNYYSNADTLKKFLNENAQAGEHIRMQWKSGAGKYSEHSIVYVSAASDGKGFYYLDYWGKVGTGTHLTYYTYEKFSSDLKKAGYTDVYIDNANQVKNTMHTHSYGSWYTKTSATCTSGGTEERKCSCGATESRSTSALGHNYGSWSTVTNATCTSGGSEKRTCSRCSNSETRSTSALGHNYGSTYFEAYHPHKYAHLCQRCGYKEFTGGNLDYYEKCDTCYNENLPGKPYLNISSNGFTESDTVSFTWDPTDKTTHYNLTVAVLSDGEYKTVCRQTYVNSGFQATFGKGQYRVVLDSYNSNMFHQYTDDWRDWIHNSSDYVYFDIDCAHEYESTIVKPTFTEKGYTLHTCTKCGYSYKDNYTPALKPTELTGVKVKTQGTASLTLAWDKNASAKGYIIEQYKGGKWTQIAKTSSNTAVTYTVNRLAADTTYTFRIKAYAISGESEIYSDYVRIAGKTRIANVASFKGSAVSASAVKLDWSKNDKATGYVIEQYRGGKWTAIATTKNNTTLTFTVKGLAKGTAYSFRIKSFRKTGSTTDFSEYTAIKAATLLDGVSNFKVASVTGSWITLEWAKNDKATGYSIEQYKGGKWTVIATTKNNATLKFTVKGLKNDTTYSFRIRAYKTFGGVTAYSDYVRIAGKTRIPNVATFKGSAVSASAVKLDWSKNDKATGYSIEQYKGGKWTVIATTKNNTTLMFTVKGLAKGTTYSFRIKSFRKTGSTTEFSEYASVKAAMDK